MNKKAPKREKEILTRWAFYQGSEVEKCQQRRVSGGILPPGGTRQQENAPSGLDHLWGIAGDGFDICQQIAKLCRGANLNAIVEINTVLPCQ